MAGTAIKRGRHVGFQPFNTAVFALTLLAACSLFLRSPSSAAPDNRNDGNLQIRSGEDCRLVHQAADQCAFVQQNCQDEEAGFLSYLHLYYCNLGHVQPVAFIILVCWTGLLFTTIGVAASDFFSINLSTIATILGLSESLAGVTFLAFGNGSPDVFSTFAAMSSNSGSMAIGELIGAAGFITSVVAGSMALVREFKVGKKTFIRDICFFVVAVAFAMSFLSDGNIYLWECCTMIAFYIFYVIVVVGWHAWDTRRKARRAREAASRGHFNAPSVHGGNDELEPYRDDPDDEDDLPTGPRGAADIDVSILERGPRIEVGGAGDNDDDYDSDDDQHVAAEMTNSMRVSRPRNRRSNTVTRNPIRPSLVGALEFRSILSSLQEEGNMRLRPIHIRTRSDDGRGIDSRLRRQTTDPTPATIVGTPEQSTVSSGDTAVAGRNRALSSGDVPPTVDSDIRKGTAENRSRGHSPLTIGGKLAPPQDDFQMGNGHSAEASPSGTPPGTSSRSLHPLQIPALPGSEASSPALSPFPDYVDSPGLLTPRTEQSGSNMLLPGPAIEDVASSASMQDLSTPRLISWWPYQALPPPHVLRDTLFPTLQGWRSKSLWDKFVSILSLPSIFLLVITMPVVENETTNDESDDGVPQLGNMAAPVSHEPGGFIESETEWQRYRRSTRSREPSRSPVRIAVDGPNDQPELRNIQVVPPTPMLNVEPPRTNLPVVDLDDLTGNEEQGWNRWLFIVQIFLGPLFCVSIVWANFTDGESGGIRVLILALLVSLVCSLVLLGALLLTTSPDRRPKYHFLICFLGFVIAIAWISTVAGEVVGVMKAFGVIFNISEAILGLTIFAVGNSVGDLVADITIARLGHPVMALSACFGGPLLNILLGIGLGGAYQTIQAANKHHSKHPDRPFKYEAYHIHVTGTLIISAITLLVTLLILLIVLPLNKWFMTRRIGFLLIALWSVSTVLNLIIELTGTWREVS